MTSITIDDGGTPRIVTDIAPLLAEQAEIMAQLERLYAGFGHGPADALDAQEPVIVALVNRYNELGDWIDEFTALSKRRANIEAGRELLKRLRGERS